MPKVKVKCNRCGKVFELGKEFPHDCVCENIREGGIWSSWMFSVVKEDIK